MGGADDLVVDLREGFRALERDAHRVPDALLEGEGLARERLGLRPVLVGGRVFGDADVDARDLDAEALFPAGALDAQRMAVGALEADLVLDRAVGQFEGDVQRRALFVLRPLRAPDAAVTGGPSPPGAPTRRPRWRRRWAPASPAGARWSR